MKMECSFRSTPFSVSTGARMNSITHLKSFGYPYQSGANCNLQFYKPDHYDSEYLDNEAPIGSFQPAFLCGSFLSHQHFFQENKLILQPLKTDWCITIK